MTQDLKALFDAAAAARTRAYAPYSTYQVGAAVRAASGRVYAGCNVENAAYPVGTCAEAGAVAAMLLGGDRVIAEVLVMGDGPADCTPCGACRQRLREFSSDAVKVHIADPQRIRRALTLGQLLPHSFGPDNLT